MWMDLSSRPLEMMLIKNLKREEALMSGGCVALAHKQHLTKTRSQAILLLLRGNFAMVSGKQV